MGEGELGQNCFPLSGGTGNVFLRKCRKRRYSLILAEQVPEHAFKQVFVSKKGVR